MTGRVAWRRRALVAVAVVLCLLGLARPGNPLAGAAWAHATPVGASIVPGSLIAALPATLTLAFSESVSLRFSTLTVTGPDGASAIDGALEATGEGRALLVHLVSHGGGTYRVSWSAVSAEDGRVTTGAFNFAVAYTSARGDLTGQAAIGAARTVRVVGLLAALTEWLLLLLAIIWAGAALLEAPAGATAGRAALSGSDAWVALIAPRARAMRGYLLEVLLGVLIFSYVLEAAQIATAGGVSPAGALIGLWTGHLGLLRLLWLLLPLLALIDLRQEGTGGQRAGRAQRAPRLWRGLALPGLGVRVRLPALGRWGHLAMAALFLLGLAAGSHAAGVAGITLSAVVLEWLHGMAAAAWIGGMGYLALAALPVLENQDLDKRAPLLIGLLRRYTPFAAAGIAVLAVTGLFAGQEQAGSRAYLLHTTYGHLLLLKLLLVAAALALTVYVLARQRARVERIWAARQRLESLAALDQIGRTLRLGLLAGALILAVTAALGASAPPVATPLPAIMQALPALPSGAWNTAGLQNLVIHRLLFVPHNRHALWAATTSGVWFSGDDQHTWTARGLHGLPILDLLIIDNSRTLLAAAANGQLYRTRDQGRHWQRLGHPFGTHPLRTLAAHDGVVLAGGDDGLFRSTDDSGHWHPVPAAAGQGIATVYWSDAAGRWIAGVQRGPWQIYSAPARATGWRALPGAPASQAGVLALASAGADPARFLAGAGGDGGWAAPAATGSWTRISGVAAGSTVAALLPDGRVYSRYYLGTTDAGAYGSVDGGTSWTPLGHGGPKVIHNLVMRSGDIRILYAATNHGVYKLTIGP